VLNQRVTGKFPTISERLRRPKKKTATLGVGAQGSGGNLIRKVSKTSKGEFRAKAPLLASVRLKGLFTDEGHFYGWEVAR